MQDPILINTFLNQLDIEDLYQRISIINDETKIAEILTKINNEKSIQILTRINATQAAKKLEKFGLEKATEIVKHVQEG